MASSNHGNPGNGSQSPGRAFASVDPERQREVPPEAPRPASPDKGQASADHAQPVVPGGPARPTGTGRNTPTQESDDEGGSGRRHRSP